MTDFTLIICAPPGSTAAAVATFMMLPRPMSFCVVVYVAVHVMDAVGASVVRGHLTADRPDMESATVTSVTVTLPVLVIAKL